MNYCLQNWITSHDCLRVELHSLFCNLMPYISLNILSAIQFEILCNSRVVCNKIMKIESGRL